MRQVPVGSTDPLLNRVYFTIFMLDGETPALGEAGHQPQISMNGASFTNIGISVLTSTGFGRYHAQLDSSILITNGDIIQTVYTNPGIVEQSSGDVFIVGTAVPEPTVIAFYGSVQDADFFFSQRLNTTPWDSNDFRTKQKALTHSTQIIDQLNFGGCKADPNQLLQFPRKNIIIDTTWITPDPGLTPVPPLPGFVYQGPVGPGQLFVSIDLNVPTPIKQATYLTALALFDGWDPDMEAKNVVVTGDKYGPTQSQYTYSQMPPYILAGLPNISVWNLLQPFIRDSHEILLERES